MSTQPPTEPLNLSELRRNELAWQQFHSCIPFLDPSVEWRTPQESVYDEKGQK